MGIGVVALGALSAVGAYSSASAANAQADAQAENARRKYRLESGVAENQMEEQQGIAMEQMTEVSREFLKIRGTSTVQEAETGTSGVSSQRMEMVNRGKESEAKSKIAKEVDTNIVNIAQGMLASKIEAEGIIADANASKRNVGFNTLMGAVQGGLQGYQLDKSGAFNDLFGKASIAETSKGSSWNKYNGTIRK